MPRERKFTVIGYYPNDGLYAHVIDAPDADTAIGRIAVANEELDTIVCAIPGDLTNKVHGALEGKVFDASKIRQWVLDNGE